MNVEKGRNELSVNTVVIEIPVSAIFLLVDHRIKKQKKRIRCEDTAV